MDHMITLFVGIGVAQNRAQRKVNIGHKLDCNFAQCLLNEVTV